MKKNILILKQICKCIQKKTVLNQFYMNIQNGEIVNLIGMEDSGKEDVFSILFGQEKIDSGEIVFNRRSYTQMSQRTSAEDAGVRFISYDSDIDGTSGFIGIDNHEYGYAIGKNAAEWINDNFEETVICNGCRWYRPVAWFRYFR